MARMLLLACCPTSLVREKLNFDEYVRKVMVEQAGNSCWHTPVEGSRKQPTPFGESSSVSTQVPVLSSRFRVRGLRVRW